LPMSTVLLAFSAAVSAAVSAEPSVTIDSGTLQGGQCGNGKNGVYYKAIPYAEPPTGKLRFEPPKAYGKYPNGKLNATTPANSCIQFGGSFLPGGVYDEDWYIKHLILLSS
jgi:carboxylesterase type B